MRPNTYHGGKGRRYTTQASGTGRREQRMSTRGEAREDDEQREGCKEVVRSQRRLSHARSVHERCGLRSCRDGVLGTECGPARRGIAAAAAGAAQIMTSRLGPNRGWQTIVRLSIVTQCGHQPRARVCRYRSRELTPTAGKRLDRRGPPRRRGRGRPRAGRAAAGLGPCAAGLRAATVRPRGRLARGSRGAGSCAAGGRPDLGRHPAAQGSTR